jgi:hypothetical protein
MGEGREEGCGVEGVEKVRSLKIWSVGEASKEQKRDPTVN